MNSINTLLTLALLLLLSTSTLAQRPQPCRSPPLLQGSFYVTTQDGIYWGTGKYIFDAFRQRIRLTDITSIQNQTHSEDVLLLYQEGLMYNIDVMDQMCFQRDLQGTFHPLEIPSNATLIGQVVLGSLAGPGEGLLVNSWTGESSNDDTQYFLTFTEFGCLPVTSITRLRESWIVYNFYNIVLGIEDPNMLIPPAFCENATMKAETGDFFSSFF